MNMPSFPNVTLLRDWFCSKEASPAWVAGGLAIHSTAWLESCSDRPLHTKDELIASGSFRLILQWCNFQFQSKWIELLKKIKNRVMQRFFLMIFILFSHSPSLVQTISFSSSKAIAKISSQFRRYSISGPWFYTTLGSSGGVPYSHWYNWYELYEALTC